MMEFGACPRCKMDISPERKKMMPVICDSCGFTLTGNETHVEDQLQSKTMTVMGGLAVLMVGSFIQLSNWDKHALDVLPLNLKGVIGMQSPADHEAKAEICMDLKKWDCVETEYIKTAQSDSSKYLRAGNFQMKRGKHNEAAQSYYKFFQGGGQDLEASYSYARALAELGKVDEAITYFDQVLAAKPGVLQITVVNNYVKLLMKNQRYDQAKALIEQVRKDGGPTAGSFMEAEFQQIQNVKTAARD